MTVKGFTKESEEENTKGRSDNERFIKTVWLTASSTKSSYKDCSNITIHHLMFHTIVKSLLFYITLSLVWVKVKLISIFIEKHSIIYQPF